MTKPPTNPGISKSKALVCLEYALLTFCLCVLALRTIFTEGPAMQSSTLPSNLGDNLYSLSVSACLFVSVVLWLVWNVCGRRFFYRLTGIETGLVLFLIAAVVSCIAASDKRLAITHAIVFISPLLCSLLLVQILDSRAKVNLVLAVIAALGVLSAYQCFEQLFAGNKVMIEQYQENPQSMLEPLGIEPDTLREFLFEHRLYAGNVRAFFTTRNSAGSFLLLSFFAALALFMDKVRNHKSEQSKFRHYITCVIPIAVVLIALVLTKSKGGNIGLIFAAVMFIAFVRFETWIKAHRKALLYICVLLIGAGSIFIFWYGLKYDRLPGGNSMLVRWQYWRASAKMYTDYPLTGVGAGNFTGHYSHYKPAAALESVSDPHNFPLSVLAQYGPLGMLGFLAMIAIPLWKIAFPKPVDPSANIREQKPDFNTSLITFMVILWLGLVLARHFVLPAADAGNFAVMVYIITRFFIPAMVVFIVALLHFRGPSSTGGQAKRTIKHINITAAVLFCALLGVALHNLTDFAIFEPGVYTTFWTILACLIATDSCTRDKREIVLKPAPVLKVLTVIAAFSVCWVFLHYALVPVALSTTNIEKANNFISLGRYDRAHNYLHNAAVMDSLSPVAPSLDARLYLHHYRQLPDKTPELLYQAEGCLKTAIERNSADFKNYERLAEVYLLLSEISASQQQIEWLNKAFGAASDAIERYPGCGRLHFESAQIAEKLDRTDTALEEYKKTIEIEQQYRLQFKIMYPEIKETVSRLGEKKFQIALDRVKVLSITP